jgi:hypothetical protein
MVLPMEQLQMEHTSAPAMPMASRAGNRTKPRRTPPLPQAGLLRPAPRLKWFIWVLPADNSAYAVARGPLPPHRRFLPASLAGVARQGRAGWA